jgi:TolB-like protein
MKRSCLVSLCVLVSWLALPAKAQDKKEKAEDKAPAVHPLAIFPFQERGPEVKGLGAKVSDILFAELVANPDLLLVDREDLKKTTDEQELSLSGLTNPAEANRVGHLTGAKILVTGSVVQTDQTLHLIAKIVGTETGRVLGASAKGAADEKLDTLVTQLAEQVSKTIVEKAEQLLPQVVTREDRLAALKKELPKGKKPSVLISIAERHVGQATIDPAAETELSLWCKDLGFEVLDPATAARNQADLVITGEGFSEFASRHGNLISVKARLEIKAVERASSNIVAIDREVAVTVDLTEQIAGKKALQDATIAIAERLLPKLVAAEKNK